MSEIRVLVVPVDEATPLGVVSVDGGHSTFCGLVGDVNTDTVFSVDGAVMMKVPANGEASEAHVLNPRATRLMAHLLPGYAKRDRVLGAAVFVGLDAEGEAADVSVGVLEFAGTMFGTLNR